QPAAVAAESALSSPAALAFKSAPAAQPAGVADPSVASLRQALRRLMSAEVGIVRSDASLARAAQRIGAWDADVARRWRIDGPSRDLLELRNLLLVAGLVVRAAVARHESRGAHFNRDWPGELPVALPTVLCDDTAHATAA